MTEKFLVFYGENDVPLLVCLICEFLKECKRQGDNIKLIKKKANIGVSIKIAGNKEEINGEYECCKIICDKYEQDFNKIKKLVKFHLNENKKTLNVSLSEEVNIEMEDVVFWLVTKLNNYSLENIFSLKKWQNVDGCEFIKKFKEKYFKKYDKNKTSYAKLKNIELVDKVVTRFPPEPSGYLHIGHAKAALLNKYYADQYNGELLIRFDDTNPAKEKEEYVENIIRDLKILSVYTDQKITFSSDYFDTLEDFAIKLLTNGNAYIDTSSVDDIKESRRNGYCTKCRDNSVEENLKLWCLMKKGEKYVMRAKIESKHGAMKHLNKSLRDPSLYRVVNNIKHYRQGNKYKIYPLYDFACPIIDSIEGVTHAFRSNEYHDRNKLYYWVLKKCGLRKVFIEDYSRLNFAYTVLSKRKLQKIIDSKKVSGWNDPSLPTIQGLLRRGLTIKALKEFIMDQGSSKSSNLMEIDKLWAINRKLIDLNTERHTAIDSNYATLNILNFVNNDSKYIPFHNKNKALGSKLITFSSNILIDLNDANLLTENEEITLMNFGNFICTKLIKNDDGNVITIEVIYNPSGSFKNTRKITWLNKNSKNINVIIKEYDTLLIQPKCTDKDIFEDIISPQIEFTKTMIGSETLCILPKSEIIQLERKGYFIIDKPYVSDDEPIEMIRVPEGKKKAMDGSTQIGHK